MRGHLIDCWRSGDALALWIKTEAEDIRVLRSFRSVIHAGPGAAGTLDRSRTPYTSVERMTFLGERIPALRIELAPSQHERTARLIERGTRWRVPLYDVDLSPEDQYLWGSGLFPCGAVEVTGDDIKPSTDDSFPQLTTMRIRVIPAGDIRTRQDVEVRRLVVDDAVLGGDERSILSRFATILSEMNPDVLVMDYAFSRLPYLEGRMQEHGIRAPWHRWDEAPITYKGGKPFYSYGQVRYHDFATRLHGRLLVDTSTMMGEECDTDGLAELCRLSGMRLQQLASRSPGATFQTALLREMFHDGLLIPYKEKLLDPPTTLLDSIKTDRAGHIIDPLPGFHARIASLDFTSMYPHLMVQRNISAEAMVPARGKPVPGVPLRIDTSFTALVPRALKPFLDKRLEYKRNPSGTSASRAAALKSVLVCSNGYLRFREFKLGLPSSHVALSAYAREALLDAQRLAEDWGFDVVQGLIDSLCLRKDGIDGREVERFRSELAERTGIPVSSEGIFRWVVFLRSVRDPHRRVPARYFGVFETGKIKARGIAMRRKGTPLFVKESQRKALERMARCSTEEEIASLSPQLGRQLRSDIASLRHAPPEALALRIKLTKTEYTRDIAQRHVVRMLREKDVKVYPGQVIHYVQTRRGPVLPEDYRDGADVEHYAELLVRAYHELLMEFGLDRDDIRELARPTRQTVIREYLLEPFLIPNA